MPRILTAALIFTTIVISLSFSSPALAQEANAIVEHRSGVDVYVLCRPVKGYKVIDSGRITMLVNSNELINKPIKKAAAQGGDGVIIFIETARYDVIRYEPEPAPAAAP